MLFREREGMTLIVIEDAAEQPGWPASFRCRMITLNIHSSLEAVGFLAAITARLAAAGMGVNPVSAFYHDHLFVPADRAEEAMDLLRSWRRTALAKLRPRTYRMSGRPSSLVVPSPKASRETMALVEAAGAGIGLEAMQFHDRHGAVASISNRLPMPRPVQAGSR